MKKEEFLQQTEAFAESMREFFSRPQDQWGQEDFEPMSVEIVKTCRTSGCPWDGVAERMVVDVPSDGVYKVFCAACRSAVEDLDPMLEDDEDYRLPTRYPDGSSWLLGVQ